MTDEQLISAAMASEGLITRMARILDMTPTAVTERLEQCPVAKDALLCARAEMCATANGMLRLAVQQGQQWAVERVLDTWAREDALANVRRVDVTSNGKDVKSGVLIVPGESAEDEWTA